MSVGPYPAYRETGESWIGSVPVGWSMVALKRMVGMQSGEQITSEQIEAEGLFPVYGGNGLRGYTSSFTHDGQHALIGRQGALCGNVNYASGRFWASEHAVVVSPKQRCDIRWIGELLRAMDLGQYSVTAAQPGLSVEAIGNLRIPVPPLSEQLAIASFLDHETSKIDALVAEQERLIALLQEKRQAVISHAVTKGLSPNVPMKDSGVEWLGLVPAHWEVKRVKYVARLESGHTPSKQHSSYWDDGDIDWVSLNDTKHLASNDYISETSVKITADGLANSSARVLPAGAVVFTRDATIGLAAITTKPMAVSQHLIAWCPSQGIDKLYLLRVFNVLRPFLDASTSGATLKTIGMPDIKKLVTPLPPLIEQVEIVAAINLQCTKLDTLLLEGQHAVILLRERRAALISAAVTGKMDIRDHAAAAQAEAA